jgi:RNA polymerase sigma-70 factor (ECF subfamily)
MDKQQLDRAFFSIQKALRLSLGRIVSSSQDIDDVVQETYLRAVANNTSNSIKDAEGYLFRTSRNIALNEKARLYHQLEVSLPVEEVDQLTVLINDKPVERDVERKQQFAEYCLAVSDLPIQCRRVFVLRKVYGYSQKEIANELGISLSTVETHITKGMQRMRQSMKQREAGPINEHKRVEGGKNE